MHGNLEPTNQISACTSVKMWLEYFFEGYNFALLLLINRLYFNSFGEEACIMSIKFRNVMDVLGYWLEIDHSKNKIT